MKRHDWQVVSFLEGIDKCPHCGWERHHPWKGKLEYRRGNRRTKAEPECSGIQKAGTG